MGEIADLIAKNDAERQQLLSAPQPNTTSAPTQKDAGAVGTGVQQFAENVAPNAAGMLAAETVGGVAAKAAVGGAVAAGLIPEELAAGPVGWAIAGVTVLSTMAAASGVARAGQEAIQKNVMGEDKFEAYKQDLAQNARAHPIAALAGNLVTQMPFMGFNAENVNSALGTAKELSTLKSGEELGKWLSVPENAVRGQNLFGIALATSVGAVQNGQEQLARGDGKFNLLEFGGNVLAGAYMNEPTGISESIGKRIGGPLGELLTRNLTATEAEKAAYEKAGLTKMMQDGHNNIASYYAAGDVKAEELANAHGQAADLLGAQDSARFINAYEEGRKNQYLQSIVGGKMIDASISEVNRMRQQDLIAQETGTKELDAATRNIGATHMDLGAVAANKEYAPQNIPQYIWGQDIARDEIKNGIGAQVEKLNADLQKGINDLKSGKETWWTNDSLNHTASLLDERRHAYNDIQSQTWEERMADQQKPAVIDAKLQEERMKLASFQRQYGIQDQRASVNNAADAMVAELMAQKEAYAKAASEASDPVRAQSIASQIATSRGRNGRIQWQQRFYAFRRIATEQAGQLAQQETQKLESQRPQIQEAVQAFRERAASGRASGNVKEADSWDEYLNRIDAEPNVRKQIEMLAALDPKHPQVRALTEAADAHNLLGTFDETRLPKTSPEQGAADAIDKDVGIQIQKRATNDRAALGEVSKTVMEEGDQARRRGIDSMKVASQQIGEATTNLFKAARLAKVKSAQVQIGRAHV